MAGLQWLLRNRDVSLVTRHVSRVTAERFYREGVWRDGMFQEEKTFNFRFSLEATFPEDYQGQEDDYAWLQDWETRVKPELMKTIFESLRRYSSWNVHVRNRGKSPHDEIEIALMKDYSHRNRS